MTGLTSDPTRRSQSRKQAGAGKLQRPMSIGIRKEKKRKEKKRKETAFS